MFSYAGESEVEMLVDKLMESGCTKYDLNTFEQLSEEKMREIRGVLRGTHKIVRKKRRWKEENGVITFTLPPTDGTTGHQWIERLEPKGVLIPDVPPDYVLKSKEFVPSTGVTYEVTVLKGELFSDDDRTSENIRAEAKRRGLSKLPAEAACLMREFFTYGEICEMQISSFVNMHEPIKDSYGDLCVLFTVLQGSEMWLGADDESNPYNGWHDTDGFAFGSRK